jgi:enamine deaminase RidA (YjgF/YER057c/UK114 family)
VIQDHEARGRIQSFNVHGLPIAPGFPIRHVTVVDLGDLYLMTLSGMIGNDSTGSLVGQDTYAQAMQTFENIRKAIVAAGNHVGIALDEKQALSCITFSRADVADLTKITELNRAYIDAGMPLTARAALEAKRLPRDAAVEITVTAVLAK